MVFARRLRARLLGCTVLCVVLSACPGSIAAQTQSPRSANPHRVAPNVKFAELGVARFRKRVERSLSASGADKGLWGVLVTDAATGQVLYALHADNYFAPASDAKLFTTALALATLGPEYRIRTTISTFGSLDEAGLLRGDLILNGAGDANLSNRTFPYEKKGERDGPPEKVLAELADAVAARGLKEISGSVIADDSLFQLERFPSGWTIDDMLWPYGAAVSAIAFNDNTFMLEIRPAEREGDAAAFTLDPSVDFYIIENFIRTGGRGSEERLAVARQPGSHLIHVSGAIPAGAQPRRLRIAIEEPAEYAAMLLARLLEARGIRIHGSARARHTGEPPLFGADRPSENLLAMHMSPPLAEEIRLVNKNSLNLHAELLLLLAVHEKTGATARQEALTFAADFFKTAGIAGGDVKLCDGSGLSRRDLVTPRAIVQMLKYAAAQPWGELYRSSLPVAGEDGTLSERMKNTAAAGRVFAKTGTIEHVNSLSGYATTSRGAHLIFSILGNNNDLSAHAADTVLDSIAVAMVEELGPAPPAIREKPKK
jgi:serine-type D-Ala-D-Ala carboxypeptidase/endopeptidase (penicillin-binding protein 4)